jgi:exosortase family protein XrtF
MKPKLIQNFVIKAGLLYAAWLVAEHQGWTTPLHQWLTEVTTVASTAVLRWWEPTATYSMQNSICYISLGSSTVLHINSPCNGLTIILLYIGFLVAYPGRWLTKVVFMVLGSVVVYVLNIGRVVALTLNYAYAKNSFDFNHKYTFVFIVYAAVFLLWVTWVNNYSIVSKKVIA